MHILTHNYPTPATPTAGIWLQRAFGDQRVTVIGKWRGWWRGWRAIRASRELVVACWMMPAGVLAFLSGRPYVLYAIGLDCFLVQRHAWLAAALRPVAARARLITFASEHARRAFEEAYGDAFAAKSRLVRLPVDVEAL